MNNRTKGVIAGIAGLALLTGGTTFALWSDSATVTGGTITNGNLDVAAIGTLNWVDTSADRADAGHAITNLGTWRMVPGDVITGTQGLGVALEGDNLVANLVVDTTAPTTIPAGMTVTYDVLQGATVVANDVPLGTDSTLRLVAARTGQGAGTATTTGSVVITDITVPTTANLTVVITATFDAATANQVSVTAQTVLGNIAISLNQTRAAADPDFN
jgi:alternate signal-mediated exported protein